MLLLVRIGGARNIIKRARDANPQEIVHIVIIWIAVLIILISSVAGRNIVEVVKECFSDTKFQ